MQVSAKIVPESIGISIFAEAGTIWTFVGKDNSDAATDWVSKGHIDQLSRWTLASNISNPLPLTILSFTAKLVRSSEIFFFYYIRCIVFENAINQIKILSSFKR
jgi:hypothetical protein